MTKEQRHKARLARFEAAKNSPPKFTANDYRKLCRQVHRICKRAIPFHEACAIADDAKTHAQAAALVQKLTEWETEES